LNRRGAGKDLNRIIVPINSLVLLCGPAGCGKSTFAARQFLPTQVVSSDECRALVSDDASNQKVTGHAFDLMHFIIEKRLLLVRLTVADATNLKREDRGSLVRIGRWFGFNTILIAFNTTYETCRARNSARDRMVPDDALAAQYELFEKTLKTIKRERFDSVYIIDEADQDDALVEVVPFTERQRRSR
jgi:protein phosphatase